MEAPLPKTAAGFRDLVQKAVTGAGITTDSEIAACAHISEFSLSRIFACEFPDASPSASEGNWSTRRIHKGIEVVVRLCDTFNLDLDSSLEALGLQENDQSVIPRLRAKAQKERVRLMKKSKSRGARAQSEVDTDMLLNADDIEMLGKQIELLGPLPLALALQLVETLHNKKESGGVT